MKIRVHWQDLLILIRTEKRETWGNMVPFFDGTGITWEEMLLMNEHGFEVPGHLLGLPVENEPIRKAAIEEAAAVLMKLPLNVLPQVIGYLHELRSELSGFENQQPKETEGSFDWDELLEQIFANRRKQNLSLFDSLKQRGGL